MDQVQRKKITKSHSTFKSTLAYPLTVAVGLAFAFSAVAQTSPMPQNAPKTTPSDMGPHDSSAKEKLTDASFVQKVAAGSMAEVELSKIAASKSSNAKIKQFAAMMVKDHEATNKKLKQIATGKNLAVPATLGSDQQKMLGELRSLSGDEFDRTYVDIMKKDHDTTVGLFDNAAGESALDPALRAFATETLPTLREHQKRAHGLVETRS